MGARAQFDLAGGLLRRVHLHKVAPFGDVIGAVLHPIAVTFRFVPLEGVGVFPFLHRPQLDLSPKKSLRSSTTGMDRLLLYTTSPSATPQPPANCRGSW